MSDDDGGTLSINLPPITAQSRSISGERIETLKNLTAKYRVTVNSMTREGTEVSYTFRLPVGIVAKITVECLNPSGEVIVRAYKEHKVMSRENNVSISLKNDGNEIINGGVTYSYGDAAAGGAVTGFPPSIKVEVGGKFTVTGDSNNITWDYGTFVEWKANVVLTAEGGNQIQAGGTVPVGTYIMPSQNVILTAQWQKYKYTITYDSNSPAVGATVSSVTDLPQTDALTQVTLAAPTVTNNPVTVGVNKKNYTFLHWKDTSDGDKTYSAGSQITLTKDMTLEAVWSDKDVYTVTYSSSDGNSSVAATSCESGQNVAISFTPAPTRNGYEFVGWTEGSSDTVGSNATYMQGSTAQIAGIDRNYTLYAVWRAKSLKVKYSANAPAGSTVTGSVADTDRTYGQSFNLAQNSFAVQGYTFNGWFSAATGGSSVGGGGSSVSSSTYTSQANDITVYAQWTAIDISVTLNKGSGTGTDTQPVKFTLTDTQDKLPATTTFTKQGYELSGWATSSGGGKVTFDELKTAIQSNTVTLTGTSKNSLTLYTVWQEMTTLYVSTTGNDDANDGSQTKPFATLQKAFDVAATLTASTPRTISVQSALYATAVTMTSRTITLNLNSNTITGTGAASVITINGGSLTLDGSGTITGGGGENGGGVYVKGGSFTMNNGTIIRNAVTGNGGGVYVDRGAVFTMNDGIIDNNEATNANAGNGGGIYSSGTLRITGTSVISNNTARVGGGVNAQSGTFTMNGGTVESNSASYGAAIATSGTTTIKGSSVISNNKENYSNVSGNIYVNLGTLTLSENMQITNNTGNGVYTRSTVTMDGGTISDNTGSGVVISTNGTVLGVFTFNGGTISNNTGSSTGGVYVQDSRCTFDGTGGTLSGNKKDTSGVQTPSDYKGEYTGSANTDSWVKEP